MRSRLLIASLLYLATFPAQALDYSLGDIKVQSPWSRATASSAPSGIVYMNVVNHGMSDRLVKTSTDVCRAAELHTHIMDGQVMRMRHVPEIEIAGGTETKLAPGGLHVMLIGLKGPLKEGTTFPLALTFEKAGTLTVEVQVLGISARAPSVAPSAPTMDMKHKGL